MTSKIKTTVYLAGNTVTFKRRDEVYTVDIETIETSNLMQLAAKGLELVGKDHLKNGNWEQFYGNLQTPGAVQVMARPKANLPDDARVEAYRRYSGQDITYDEAVDALLADEAVKEDPRYQAYLVMVRAERRAAQLRNKVEPTF